MKNAQRGEAVAALLAAAEKSCDTEPVCAAQLALARDGELLLCETFGRAWFDGQPRRERAADASTLFVIYSVTKAVVTGAVLLALQEEAFALTDRVAMHIPEFAARGKQLVTVEQLLTHTAGFPSARMPNPDWEYPQKRLEHFSNWRIEWEPGSRCVYHGLSSMWVLAELITRGTGLDYRDFIRSRMLSPLGLENLYIGLPDSERDRVARVISVGEAGTSRGGGSAPVDAPVVDDALLAEGNDPAWRRSGSPGGGGIATAADVAMYYQALLADAAGTGPGIWRPEILREAWRVRNPEFLDPMTKQAALRGLGFAMAGESGRIWRGFPEACSARSFGHMGAGGQVSWADPESGLSFVFLTNGARRDPVRQGANGLRLSTLAACVSAVE
jgi:CubicO group peptidase (beta-lactamase class C family)